MTNGHSQLHNGTGKQINPTIFLMADQIPKVKEIAKAIKTEKKVRERDTGKRWITKVSTSSPTPLIGPIPFG